MHWIIKIILIISSATYLSSTGVTSLCRDKNKICFSNAKVLGYFTQQCSNSTSVREFCPYMCGVCDHEIYQEAEVYFSFDDLTNLKNQIAGTIIEDGIIINEIGRRKGSLSMNGSTCLQVDNSTAQIPYFNDPSGSDGISFALFFAYALPAESNTDLTYFTTGGHTDSTGIYFGYSRALKKFMVKIKSSTRQYTAYFREEDIPSTERYLIHLAVTCTLTEDTGILASIRNGLGNIHDLTGSHLRNSKLHHTGLKIYIEGKLLLHERNFTTEILTNTHTNVTIGCINKGETWHHLLKLDELAVWDRVLSPSEVFDIAIPNDKIDYQQPIHQLDSELINTKNNLDTAKSVVESLNGIFRTKMLNDEDVREVVSLWSRLAAAKYPPRIDRMSLIVNTTPSPVDEDNLVQRVGDTVDKFLGVSNREAVANLSNQEPEALPNFVQAIDSFLGKISRFSLSPDATGTLTTTQIRNTIEIRVKVDTNAEEEYTYDDGISAFLDTPLKNASGALLVNVLYKGVGSLFPTTHNITLQYNGTHNNNTRNNTYLKLGDDILGMSVYDKESYPPASIIYRFKLPQIPGADVYPHCVFLKFNNSSEGGQYSPVWSDVGCVLLQVATNSVTCTCGHLTNFAVLMQVVPFEISESDLQALEVITYIGCSLSIVGATLTILTFILLRIFSDRVMIHLNLAIAIIAAQIIFLIEESIPRATSACTAVTVLLYYFNMAIFCWMLVEGTQLFLQIVIVFSSDSKMKIFYGIGWGVPFVLSCISIAVLNSSIGQNGVCWLSASDNSIWAFAVPAIFVISTNLIILTAVMKVVINLSKTMEKSKTASIKNAVKASVFLLPLLGTTWLFGVMAISGSTVVFQYIFALTNSLQGFMLFICHCVCNSEVRECFIRRKSTWDLGRQIRIEPISYVPKIAESFRTVPDPDPDAMPRAGTESPSTDSSAMDSLPGSAKSGFRRR